MNAARALNEGAEPTSVRRLLSRNLGCALHVGAGHATAEYEPAQNEGETVQAPGQKQFAEQLRQQLDKRRTESVRFAESIVPVGTKETRGVAP
jgi:hypothetical protein